jgi:hypothetical protein
MAERNGRWTEVERGTGKDSRKILPKLRAIEGEEGGDVG